MDDISLSGCLDRIANAWAIARLTSDDPSLSRPRRGRLESLDVDSEARVEHLSVALV
jgi:hypothetical protein